MKAHAQKTKLISAIRTCLAKRMVETQTELCQFLSEQGLIVTQARISRMLHTLGAIKVRESNRMIYRLPVELSSVKSNHALREMVMEIMHNEHVVVIRTTPGSAQLLARLLDQQRSDIGILGTVAGDDTILVIPNSVRIISKMLKKIRSIFS